MSESPVRRVLLVDDDSQSLESTQRILTLSGFDVVTATDGAEALERIRPPLGSKFDVVVTDVRMPKLGGIEFLRALSLCGEQTPVILMTAFGRVEDAVWAMKLGAVDFLTKPFKRQTLVTAIESALKRVRRPDGSAVASTAESSVARLIGASAPIHSLRAMIAQVAPTAATVLLTGESGTGKEMVARCLHQQSTRAHRPFIALNCAAVPDQLIESELFGFEKGSFTGAATAKEGLFEAANGGTLLLDEIGDMPVTLQAKLLRTLQESEVRRLGATLSKKIDVRVIAATHQNLQESVQLGKFRQDLLFRLEVISITVPPLRNRSSDIPELASHFLKIASQRHGKELRNLSSEALEILMTHDWPGNVRELSNVVERAVVFAMGDEVRPEDLPPHLASLRGSVRSHAESESTISVKLGTPLKDVEELMIRKTLEATSGDKNMTAKLLGINSRTIYRKLDKRSDS